MTIDDNFEPSVKTLDLEGTSEWGYIMLNSTYKQIKHYLFNKGSPIYEGLEKHGVVDDNGKISSNFYWAKLIEKNGEPETKQIRLIFTTNVNSSQERRDFIKKYEQLFSTKEPRPTLN